MPGTPRYLLPFNSTLSLPLRAALTLLALVPVAWVLSIHSMAAGAWSAAPSLPLAVQEVSVTAVGGHVYVVGGSNSQSRVNTVYVLDPAAAAPAWTTRTPYPGTARDHIGIASIGTALYLVGGVASWPTPSVDTVQRYEATTNTWTAVAPLPVPRGAMAVAALNGRIFAAGGLVNGAAVTDFTVYDPATDVWQTLPAMPTPRDHAVGVALNGKFYVTGGRTSGLCSPLKTVEVYDPVSNNWSSVAPMQHARAGHGAAAVDGRMYVFGGEGAVSTCGTIASTEEYDPSANAWMDAPPMPTPRHGTNGAAIGSTIYVPGGGTEAGDAPTATVEKLDTGAAQSLPAPWTSADIGAVGLAGSAAASGGVFTVAGAGADIWGDADSFHFVSQPMTGDGQIVARVASMQNTHPSAKAGLMLRASLTPGSAHVILDVTPSGGLEFMTRSTNGGATAYLSGAPPATPVWLRLARSGSTVIGSWSSNGTTWTEVARTTITLPATIRAGLPVASHDTSVRNTSTFDNVSLTAGPANQPPSVTITAPSNGASFNGPAAISVAATAADTDGTIASVQFFANGTSIGTDTTSPYGLTWNQSTPGSYTLTALATDSGGAQTQSAPVTINVTTSGGQLPSPWTNSDIGAVGLAGSASYSNGVFTVKGAGADIWGNADSFHFMYQPLSGDGQITVRVTSLQNTHVYAKAGLMFRQSLAAGSAHVMLDVLPGGSVEFMSRGTSNGAIDYHGGQALPFPGWLKLIRTGNSFASYTSVDGSVWTHLGSVTVQMTETAYVGLPVLSHNVSVLTSATFDSLAVSKSATPPTTTISFGLKGVAVAGTTSGTAYGIPGFLGPTSLQLGPDGRLYVSTFTGKLYVLTMDQAAVSTPGQVAVLNVQQLNDIFTKPSRTCNIGGNPFNCQYPATPTTGRLVTGLLIDPASTANEIILYVSNSGLGQGHTDMSIDTYSGTLTRLRLRPDTSTANPHDLQVLEHTDLVTGMPRSREVHAVNGMSVGPDGWLYLAVGGHTNGGQPSEFFANLPEYHLSAAVVRLNLAQLVGRSLPIDVSHVKTASHMAPLAGIFEMYATGYRNAYDLTWHSNGKLYLNDNAANLGQGNTPGASDGCNTPSVAPGDQPDDLNLVSQGAYGGHPNPTHGECVFDNGAVYAPKLTPHPAYVPPLLAYLNGSSTNGIVEYASDAFGGLMKGNLISATFGGNQNVRRVVLNATGTAVIQEQNLAGFVEPLDVSTDAAGNIYVAEYGANRITVMVPTQLGTCPVPNSNPAVTDSDGDGYKDADETANNTDPCSPASKPADFDADFVSDLNDPDDDNDGIPDAQDQLFFDAQNGAATAVPLAFEYNPTSPAAGYVVNTGFRGAQISSSGVRLSPSNIKAGDAGGHLTFSTHAGTAAGAANSGVNTLQLGFDSTSAFRIWTRVVQPFTATPPATDHAGGIFFGPGQDNFFRLALVGTSSGGIAAQAALEVGAAFTVRGTSTITASPLSHVDLIIVGNSAAKTLSAYVEINTNGTLVPVVSDVPVPPAWFSTNASAAANTSLGGIMTSHGASQMTAFGFDFFRIDRSVPVPPGGDPPAVPGGPLPPNGASGTPTTIALNWAASQGATHYDVALGTTAQPPIVSSTQTATHYQPSAPLQYSTTYYWRVTAKGAGGATEGPLWSFTTTAAPPPPPPSTTLRRLRVMTWNVNGGRSRTNLANVDAQVSLMARSGAHVIVLQEVTVEPGVDLSTLYKTKLSAATGVTWNAVWGEEPRPAPAVPQGNLVLTPLPLGASETIPLEGAPGTSSNLDAQRSAARIAVVVNGVTVTIATAALAADPVSRQVQVDQLQSWMSTVTGPRLLGGSFNMRPGDPGYADLAGTFANVWSALVTTPDAGITTETFGSPAQPARVDGWWQELDAAKAGATEVWVIKTGRSDHHAVVAEVNVR